MDRKITLDFAAPTDGMSTVRVKRKRIVIILIVIAFVAICGYGRFVGTPVFQGVHRNSAVDGISSNAKLKGLKLNSLQEGPLKGSNKCKMYPHSIEDLVEIINTWKSAVSLKACRELYDLFSSIYKIREKVTTISITDTFMAKVQKWLHNNPDLISQTKKQHLLFVDNIYSLESVVFNPVRAKRPGASAGNAKFFMKNLVNETSQNCDFCNYKKFTAHDDFGVLESTHTAIVSNAFKIERYHGMALLKKHNPVDFTLEEYMDQINLIGKWFKKANSNAPDHLYRHMYCDVFPKSSASQVHPHIHLTLANDMYYMKWNRLHAAALNFAYKNLGENYWDRIIKIHFDLKLGIRFGDAVALAYITPQKDHEVFVIAPKPTINFFQLTFCVIRAFYDDLNLYAVSMGYVFPKLKTSPEREGSELPAIVRIISRGPIDSARSDVSSFDLFGTPNVNKDPFSVAPVIRNSVKSRCSKHLELPDWEWD